ncbi:MAG: ZIP family metal transporter [Oscillospiraceae bacterium]|nr:ZIP family metal transporter [Oscillospiraceae bacterium]
MHITVITALLLPLVGTTLGAAWVLLPGRKLGAGNGLSGFAAGVMTAASIWSLLLPAIEGSAGLGVPEYLPALAGILAGFAFLQVLEAGIPRVLQRQTVSMTVLAVALHNLPEGMAVGAALVAWLRGGSLGEAEVLALALGIAIQNLPEGTIISLPLAQSGMKRSRALSWGFLSGVVEPLGAAVTVLLAGLLVPALPWLLSFSAGAMLYVVVRELIPESGETKAGVWGYAAGFSLMMVLDVALG